MELFVLLILAILIRIPFILQAGNLLDFDEATFALMAKRIFEGELPIHISGHSYSGSFISFLMAPFIAFLGPTALSVRLTSLALFLGFFTINYFLFKRIANKRIAVIVSIFFILMPQGVFDVSMRIWGGHAELWIFQAATLLCLTKYFDGPQHFFSGKLFFILGLILGTALWISDFFLLFLIPFLTYFFLRFRQPQDDSIFRWLFNFFRLWHFKLPAWLRKALIIWHVILVFILLIHLTGVLLGHQPWIPEKLFKLFGAVPPFQIKMMKKLALIFVLEILAVYYLHSHSFSRLLMFGNLGPLLGGLFLGYFPALLFGLAGGEGLRIFQKSGALGATEIPARAQMIFTQKIPQFILGLGDPFYLDPDKLHRIGFLIFAGIVIAGLCVTGVYYWRDLKLFIRPRPGMKPSYVWIFFGIVLLTLISNLISTLEAARYLAPLYLGLAAILAYFLGEVLWKKLKLASIILILFVSTYFSYGSWLFYQGIPNSREASYTQILDYLASEKIHGGLAVRTLSHILTYLSGEKIVFSTYRQPERYLPHEHYTKSLSRRAYVFETDDSAHEAFQKDEELRGKITSKKVFGPHVVYIVKLPSTDPEGRPYTPKPHRFPVHVYLNK